MREIKVSFPELLPSLVNKTKTTTIRKAYFTAQEANKYTNNKPYPKLLPPEKICKYEVGETCEFVWTGDMNFCYGCGRSTASKVQKYGEPIPTTCGCKRYIEGSSCVTTKTFLDNPAALNLGKVKITKVEKIQIGKLPDGSYFILDDEPKMSFFELSDMEGFESPDQMFGRLETYSSGLEEPKPFWLISWKWLI